VVSFRTIHGDDPQLRLLHLKNKKQITTKKKLWAQKKSWRGEEPPSSQSPIQRRVFLKQELDHGGVLRV
jgi:hypothetical protein